MNTTVDNKQVLIPFVPDAPADRVKRLTEAWTEYSAGRPVSIAQLLSGISDGRFIDRARLSRRARLTVARTWTIDNVFPLIPVIGAVHDVDIAANLRPFGVLEQELLDASSPVYTEPSDFLLLLWRLEDFLPDIHNSWAWSESGAESAVEGVARKVAGLIGTVLARYGGFVLCHDFGIEPMAGGMQVLDEVHPHSPANTRAAINVAVRRELAGLRNARVLLLRLDSLQYGIGMPAWEDERLRLTAGSPFSVRAQIAVLDQVVRTISVACSGTPRKVLLLDADDTLWGGILAEDGPRGIALGGDYPGNVFVEIQKRILQLHHQGVVLGVCSKNSETDVRNLFASHPAMVLRPEHIAFWAVNWNPKSDNIAAASARLGLSMESMVFVDDSPRERDEVRNRCPAVHVPELPDNPLGLLAFWRSFAAFARTDLSAEDRMRTRTYREEETRHSMMAAAGSLEDFYRGLQMRVRMWRATEADAARIAQMSQRTNQFNATTVRMSQKDAVDMLRSPGRRIYLLDLSDKCGSSGIVGCAVVGIVGRSARLEQFMMSCRVLKRTVEQHFLGMVMRDLADAADSLVMVLVPSGRNDLAGEFFRQAFGEGQTRPGSEKLWTVPLSVDRTAALLRPWIREDAGGGQAGGEA